MGHGARDALRHALNLLADLMRGDELSVNEGAGRVPFKKATVRRHLEKMEATLPPVLSTDGRPRQWRFEWPDERQVPQAQVWAVAAGRAMLAPFKDTAFRHAMDDLLMDLSARGRQRVPREDLSRKFIVPASRMVGEVLDTVAQAIYRSTELDVDYNHFSGKVSEDLLLRPLSLIATAEGLYLFADCCFDQTTRLQDTRRLYKVIRFERVRDTRQSFVYPPADEYRPEDLFQHSFGGFLSPTPEYGPDEVVLHLAPAWETYLAHEPIHPTQEDVRALDDGWLEVRLHVFVLYDLVRWVRGLGNEVRVVAPRHLELWVDGGHGAGFLEEAMRLRAEGSTG